MDATRISRDQMYMTVARTVAKRGTCPRKQVGAVIVRDNRIISMGYNGAPSGMLHCTDVGCGGGEPDPQGGIWFVNGCTRAIHAELNAVAFSARQGQATDGAVMYSTCATCVACAQALIASGIIKFIYDEEYRVKDGLNLLQVAGVEFYKWTP